MFNKNLFNKNLSSLGIQGWIDRYKTEKTVKFGVIGALLVVTYFGILSPFISAIAGLVLGYFAYNDKVDDSCLEEN